MIYTNYQVSINYTHYILSSNSFVMAIVSTNNTIHQFHHVHKVVKRSCVINPVTLHIIYMKLMCLAHINFSKIFVKLMCARLDSYLKSNTILCTNQFGFRCLFSVRQQAEHHCCISRFLKSIRHS